MRHDVCEEFTLKLEEIRAAGVKLVRSIRNAN